MDAALLLQGAALGAVGAMAATLPLSVALWFLYRRRTAQVRALQARSAAMTPDPATEPDEAQAFQRTALAAMDAVPDWITHVDVDGTVVRSNRPAGDHFESLQDTVEGRPLVAFYPPHAVAMVEQHIDRAIQQGRSLSFEFLHRAGTAYAETRVFPLEEGLLVVTRDMTDKKAKEEFLHRSKERYALAVQGANDGLWDWNLENDEVYYNWVWRGLLGYDNDNTVDQPSQWLDRVHPEDITGVREALKAHLEGDAQRFESEHRIGRPDGSWLWVLARGMAVRDATGKARRIAGSFTDLTNRRVVAVTQEKADLLEHATSSVGIGIAIMLADRTLERVSPTLDAMSGEWDGAAHWWEDVVATMDWPPQSRCARCGQDHHLGTTLAEVRRPVTETQPLAAAALADPTVEIVADHTLKVYEIAFSGHAHEIGRATAHVVLVKDVTDKALAERHLQRLNRQLVVARDQALAASRSKSTFLANMSHELRTPLNHILGYAEMLLEEAQDEGRPVDDLQRIRSSGMHLLNLIAGILDLSRIEAGESTFDVTRFAIDTLVHKVVAGVRSDALRNGNRVEVDCPSTIGTMVADEQHIRSILVQLLSNAVKFTRDGMIRVAVAAVARDGQPWVAYHVADTGIGMTPDQVAKLTEQFYMVDDTSTREHGGAGLGLALVARYLDIMGGNLEVLSRPGRGSTFKVLLPRETVPDAGPGVVGPPDPGPEAKS